MPTELKYYGRHLRYYLKARPGLTGVWQTGGRNHLDYRDRVARDSYYVRTSVDAVDLAMLAKTVPAVLNFDETAWAGATAVPRSATTKARRG